MFLAVKGNGWSASDRKDDRARVAMENICQNLANYFTLFVFCTSLAVAGKKPTLQCGKPTEILHEMITKAQIETQMLDESDIH